jgi:hypothetical protein
MKRLVLALALIFALTPALWADVQVFDSVTASGTPVMLKARTGGFMAKGGELVDFSVDGKNVGRRLSGGDGVAYLEYTPTRPGLFEVKASWGDDVAEGLLLVVGKKDRVVAIEVPGALATGEFIPVERTGASEGVKKLLGRYRVIYMSTGLLGAGGGRAWLNENGFPKGVVLEWKGGRALEHLESVDVRVWAAVGVAGFIQEAGGTEGIKLYSFDPETEGTRVRSWDDVIKELIP